MQLQILNLTKLRAHLRHEESHLLSQLSVHTIIHHNHWHWGPETYSVSNGVEIAASQQPQGGRCGLSKVQTH